MLKIGVTGQSGFIGKHLFNSLGLFPLEFERVHFKKEYFLNANKLNEFVAQCDIIVHLASINRDPNPQFIYDTNIELTKKLVNALDFTKSKAYVLFSSTIHEENNNIYGESKKVCREILYSWSQKSGGFFLGLIIPNVFGPFCKPNYNSVIATFCHNLTQNKKTSIDVDIVLNLIYIDELIRIIISSIRKVRINQEFRIEPTKKIKVSEALTILKKFKIEYEEMGIIPSFSNSFELNLFNTYRSYIDLKKYYPVLFQQHIDNRGSFVEITRSGVGGQFSFSKTFPGIVRGNHYHIRKVERFSLIKGKALIQLRRVGEKEIFNFYLDGDKPSYIDIPIWYTHNIKNIGEDVLFTNFWVNEFYDPNDSDTYFENVLI